MQTSLEGFIPNKISRTRHNIRSTIRTLNILMRMSFIWKITRRSLKINLSSSTFNITSSQFFWDNIRNNFSMNAGLLEFVPDSTDGARFDIGVTVRAFDEFSGSLVVRVRQVARAVDSIPRFALVANSVEPVNININLRTFPDISGFAFFIVFSNSAIKMKLISAFRLLVFKVVTFPVNIRLFINWNITFTFNKVVTITANFFKASRVFRFWLGLVSVSTSFLEFAPGGSVRTGLDNWFAVGAFDKLLGVAFDREIA